MLCLKGQNRWEPGLWDLAHFPERPSKCLAFLPVCAHHLSPLLLGWSSGFSEEPKKAKGTSGGYVDWSEHPPVAFACCSPSGITTHTLWALTICGKIKSQITSPGLHSLALDPTRNSRRIPYFLDLKQELIDFRKMLKKRWVLGCLEDLEAHRVPTSAPSISKLSSPSTSDKRKEPDCR